MIQGKSGYYLVPLIRATGLYFYDNPDAFIEYGRRHNRLAPGQQQIINQHGQLEPAGWEKMKALVHWRNYVETPVHWQTRRGACPLGRHRSGYSMVPCSPAPTGLAPVEPKAY